MFINLQLLKEKIKIIIFTQDNREQTEHVFV